MTTESHSVEMTSAQFSNDFSGANIIICTASSNDRSYNNNNNTNNNNSNNNNKNLDIEQKYLHKKFKRVVTSATAVSPNIGHETNKDYLYSITPDTSSTAVESIEPHKSLYVCSYCKLICSKPSVLQKHVRAHTNERPYPCILCGFAFKTKSNLYKHCKSKTHTLKMEGVDDSKVFIQNCAQFSEESDFSLSDSTSNDTVVQSASIPSLLLAESPENLKIPNKNKFVTKIYKPKFHTALHPNLEHHNKPIEYTITDNRAMATDRPHLQQMLTWQTNLSVSAKSTVTNLVNRKRRHSEGSFNSISCSNCDSCSNVHKHLSCKNLSLPLQCTELSREMQPLHSPGPLLGTTRLIAAPVVSKPSSVSQFDLCSLNMFRKELHILNYNNKIETSVGLKSTQSIQFSQIETTSVCVRSSLHSGGIIMHKGNIEPLAELVSSFQYANIVPHISAPILATSLPCLDYIKSRNILNVSEIIPYSSRDLEHLSTDFSGQEQSVELTTARAQTRSLKITFTTSIETDAISIGKFLRPSTLSLMPDTLEPKEDHELTPTQNTLSLISPETPRPKKSYGQLYLNGHAYTYLGLKCSTRLFYCTLNRTQPMYAIQQNGLSMYSNWKICNDSPPELEFSHYDSRQRSVVYTLAGIWQPGILTHSSQPPNTSCSSENGLDGDVTRKPCLRFFDDSFKSNKHYMYIRGKGRGRYICKDCGIRCKKRSILKKHIRTHTEVKPYTCGHCAFNFKTKGNLTKHMKSNTHYKKCLELHILPRPTTVQGNKTNSETMPRSLLTSRDTEAETSEEEEREVGVDDSEDEESEDQESGTGLLELSKPDKQCDFTGLLPHRRPMTYPYKLTKTLLDGKNSTRSELTDIRSSCEEESSKPIDLTISRQKQQILLDRNDFTITNKASPLFSQGIPESKLEQWPTRLTDSQQRLPTYLTERRFVNKQFNQKYIVTTQKELQGINVFTSTKIKFCSNAEQEKKLIISRPYNKSRIEYPQRYEQSENKSRLVSSKLLEMENVVVREQQLPSIATKVVVGEPEIKSISSFNVVCTKAKTDLIQPSTSNAVNFISLAENSRNICTICSKTFSKPSQLRLHINIHYFERPFKCESCGTSFRTKGHLTKHERSTIHHNKVSMTSTFGPATASNPRPFKCTDCKSAFRIHGHLAKHLRSKMHIMKLECLRKLPFGTYAEFERSTINLNDIDTTDCDTSLASLQIMAQKLSSTDSDKIDDWEIGVVDNHLPSDGETSSDECITNCLRSTSQGTQVSKSRNYFIQMYRKTRRMDLLRHHVEEIDNESKYKCQLCRISLSTLRELHVHCFVEHNIESKIISDVDSSNSFDRKIEEKENTQRLKKMESAIGQIETG